MDRELQRATFNNNEWCQMCLGHSCTAAKLHANRHLLPVQPTRRTQQQPSLEIHQQRQFKQLLRPFLFSTTTELSFNSNSMASFAPGDRGQRFPPHFNFYNCTNVHIHNNFGPSSWISFVDIVGASFQLFCDVNSEDLTFFDRSLTDILTLSRCYGGDSCDRRVTNNI